ncbi:MAG: NAD(P)H-binding protein [Myxococcota bacterium]
MPDPKTIAIAGASGFVGRYLIEHLSQDRQVIALSRSIRPSDRPNIAWRTCDMFSLLQIEEGLAGADVAVYLAHSMLPSARLTQGRFEDMDLILADNFARAAATAGIQQIVYLGGIVSDDRVLSPHLRSRLEVERALGSYGVPVTTLRASIIVGAGGTSFGMLRRLIENAPILPAPPWTSSRCQPIAIGDVVQLIDGCLGQPWAFHQTYDVAGPDICSYRELMVEAARALGRPVQLVTLPLSPPSRLVTWGVHLITGDPRELVGPLLESLSHSMIAPERDLQDRLDIPGVPLHEMLRRAVDDPPPPEPPTGTRPKPFKNTVRSVQRMPLPVGRDAEWAAQEYMRWLPGAAFTLIQVDVHDQICRFRVIGMTQPLLELAYSPERSTPDRTLFYVTRGLLSAPGNKRGRLEFRQALNKRTMIAAIHDFVPRLPWFIYKYSQAIAHAWVMFLFGQHLGEQPDASSAEAPSSVGAS